ncbi:MAG TPA: GFA family protein [Caulobacteraceae bacterium]|jgi:hypothetical protein
MSKLPTFPIEGGCACGAVRYRVTAPPAYVYACHCTDCQTLTTSVFSLNALLRGEALEILQGELKTWVRTADSGNQIPQHVCAKCGVRIFTEAPQAPGTKTLRLGSLDDTSWLHPASSIWMKSAQPWVRMPDDTLLFEDGATDYPAVMARWREIMEIGG